MERYSFSNQYFRFRVTSDGEVFVSLFLSAFLDDCSVLVFDILPEFLMGARLGGFEPISVRHFLFGLPDIV